MSLMPAAPHVAFFSAVLAKMLAGTAGFETFGGAVIPTDRQLELVRARRILHADRDSLLCTYWLRRARVLQQQGRIGPFSNLHRLRAGRRTDERSAAGVHPAAGSWSGRHQG